MMTMTNYLFWVMVLCIGFYSTSVSSPVKMSMMLMMMSFFLFLEMYHMGSNSWFPSLFFLIFMGGILMMFMILSSILPNEKNLKFNNSLLKMVPLLSLVFVLSKMDSNDNTSKFIKSMMDSSMSFMLMMMIMLSYFFLTILMVSKEESPMRKTMCYMES